jgi:hypothetical protein
MLLDALLAKPSPTSTRGIRRLCIDTHQHRAKKRNETPDDTAFDNTRHVSRAHSRMQSYCFS